MNDGGREIIYSPTHAASMRGLLSMLLLNSAEPRILIIMSATSSYCNYYLVIVNEQLERVSYPHCTGQAQQTIFSNSSCFVLIASESCRSVKMHDRIIDYCRGCVRIRSANHRSGRLWCSRHAAFDVTSHRTTKLLVSIFFRDCKVTASLQKWTLLEQQRPFQQWPWVVRCPKVGLWWTMKV